MFDLVKLYAKQGDIEAKKAMYNRFLTNPIQGSDWVGYKEILELDGLKGLIYIAEKFGKIIKQNPEDWQDGSIIKHFQDNNPDINVTYELEKITKTNKYVKIYLDNIKRTENNWKKHKSKPQIFNGIIDEVLNSKPFISFKRRKQLSDLELQIISKHLIKEKNKEKIEKLLDIFSNRKFPLNSEFILKLAKQKSNSKYRIQEHAIDALKFLKSENIRNFALSRILKTNNPNIFTNILISNYKKGDYKLLREIATKFTSEYIIENLARSYSDIYSKNKTTECKEPLEILYRKMNCGIHRNEIVKILIDNNVLSNKISNEIKYDSYEKTRILKIK